MYLIYAVLSFFCLRELPISADLKDSVYIRCLQYIYYSAKGGKSNGLKLEQLQCQGGFWPENLIVVKF